MPRRHVYHVRMWQITHNVNMLDHYIAADKGFYEEQSLDVEVIVGTLSPGNSPAHEICNGVADFGIAGPVQFGDALRENLPLRWVLWTRKNPPHRLFGRPYVHNAQDLRGRTIGLMDGGRGLYVYLIRRWLREQGLDPDKDVHFLERKPAALSDFNVSNSPWARKMYQESSDATMYDEVHRDLLGALGWHELVEPYHHYPNSSNHGLATTLDMIEEYPEVVQRMVAAHIKAGRFIQDQGDETIDYIAERWKLSVPAATRCYETMRNIFIADVDLTHLSYEMEFFKTMPEINLPQVNAADWVVPRFGEALL